jgi:hypothetical protein
MQIDADRLPLLRAQLCANAVFGASSVQKLEMCRTRVTSGEIACSAMDR